MRSIIPSGLLLLLCATASVRAARAESMAIRGCYSLPSVLPTAGTVIPANLPAFVFKPAGYGYPIPQRTIDQYAIELRTISGDVLLPTAIEAQTDGSYLVRPQQPLPLGSVGLSFLDNCGSYMGSILDAPVRNGRFTYTVVAAASVPTAAGTATVNAIGYTTQPYSCDRPTWASATLDLVMAPGLASFPLINIRVWIKGASYDQQYSRLDAENIIRLSLSGYCSPVGSGPLFDGVNEVRVEAQVVGMPDWLQAPPLDVTIDCSPRAADAGAPFCSPDASTPDAGVDASRDLSPVELNVGAEPPLIHDSGAAWVIVEGPATPDGSAPLSPDSQPTNPSPDAESSLPLDTSVAMAEGPAPPASEDAGSANALSRSSGCGCSLGGRDGSELRADTLAFALILAAFAAFRRRRGGKD